MKRLWKELRRYDKYGDKDRLLNFIPVIGRTLSRQFSKEQPHQSKAEFRPVETFDELVSDLYYYSDRWGVLRYKRVKSFLKSEQCH